MVLNDSKTAGRGAGRGGPAAIDFERLVQLGADAIVVMSPDGTPVYLSPAARDLFGAAAGDGPGSLAGRLQDIPDTPQAAALTAILSGSGDPSAVPPPQEISLLAAGGAMVWSQVTTHFLPAGQEMPEAYVLFFRCIARRKELEDQLAAATLTDPVTGLYNQRAFEDTLKREWAIALRERSHTSLIKVSLDRFDALSKAYGESAADDCLARVARTLKDTARRPADIAARTAPSEFSLLLPRTHGMGAETISAYIQVAIQDLRIPNPDNSEGQGLLTASVGAACAVAEQAGISEQPEYIVAAAENCLVQARREGGNRVKTVMNFMTR